MLHSWAVTAHVSASPLGGHTPTNLGEIHPCWGPLGDVLVLCISWCFSYPHPSHFHFFFSHQWMPPCLVGWSWRGPFPHPDRPCAVVFFFLFFFPVALALVFFFPSVFSSVAISCPGFDIFCLFFPVTILCSVVFFFLFFFLFVVMCVVSWVHVLCVFLQYYTCDNEYGMSEYYVYDRVLSLSVCKGRRGQNRLGYRWPCVWCTNVRSRWRLVMRAHTYTSCPICSGPRLRAWAQTFLLLPYL